MPQSTSQAMKLYETERALWLEVKQSGQVFRDSVKGNRKAAASEFQAALRRFNRFIVEHPTTPKS